ncbi:hypothetical protein ACJX0J_035163, partial [Zea mays]
GIHDVKAFPFQREDGAPQLIYRTKKIHKEDIYMEVYKFVDQLSQYFARLVFLAYRLHLLEPEKDDTQTAYAR